MKSSCNRCGECCRVIHIMHTKKSLLALGGRNAEFISEHWHRISRKEAYKRLPMMRTKDCSGFYFYTCDAWDKKTGLCKMYESRPEVCSGFPFYGGKPTNSNLEWLAEIGCAYGKTVDN